MIFWCHYIRIGILVLRFPAHQGYGLQALPGEAVVRLPCACVSVRVRVRVVSGPWQYTCWSPRARVSMYCCIHGCGRVSMCHGFLRVPGCVRVSACVLVSARGRVCPPNQYHSPVLLQNVGPALRFQLFKATKSN